MERTPPTSPNPAPCAKELQNVERESSPGLQFKLVGKRRPAYSIRVGIGWRALDLKIDGAIVWFWIGSHAEYEKIVVEM